jgi:hypothetical protein
MKYFKNNTKPPKTQQSPNDYFKRSLVNLFIELGDENTANQIYSRFTRHPLKSMSENIFITPQFVEDLTNNNFNGILQAPLPKFNIEQELEKCVIPNHLEKAIQAYCLQLDKGTIQFIDSYFDPSNAPHLALLTSDNGKNYNWTVIRDEISIIQNGEIRFDSNLDKRILAILQVYKNK